jgi:methyl-accepting chemotaxis protein
MDRVTQSNAANAEESASASEELSAQAKELREMVGTLIAVARGANSADAVSAAVAAGNHARGGSSGGLAPRPHMAAARARAATSTVMSSPDSVIPLDDDDLADF